MSADVDPILECLREDVKKGCLLPLSAYLSRFPGQDRAVARAYLTMTGGEARNGEARGHHQIGHYEILRELGRGGQGIVYLAQDTRLERRVALKVLAQIGPGSEAAIDRFRREALVASRLNHPHICGVFDAGSEGGLPYIAMQYVEGMTLSQRIGAQRSGTAADESSLIIDFSDATELDPKEGVEAPAEVRSSVTSAQEIPTLLRYFERVARALHAAHEVGIVHRDIKPGNLMITKQGEPVILDFGLAHADDSAAPGMTRTGDVFGTPAYMAPEQISGHSGRVDRRADVYSVGVAMFEALTLKRPFEAPTREALYQAILTEPPPDPRPLNPAISRDLKVLLETALEKDRDRRYASASALADDILAILEHRPIRARAIGPTGRLLRWAQREPAKAALLLVLLVALPVVAALVTARMKDVPKLEAARRAEAAHEQDQRLAEANFEMSEGDKRRAIALYERALADDPACGEAVVGLVLSHQNLGHLDLADRVLEEHQAVLGEGSATKLLKAQSWVLRGREDEARQIIGETPPPITGFEHYVVALRELGLGERGEKPAFQRALHHVTAAILLSPSPTLALTTLRAHIAGHLRDEDAALESAAGLRGRWPQVDQAQYWASYALGSLGDLHLESALDAAAEALRLNPGVIRYHLIHAHTLGRLRRMDEALAAYRELLRIDPHRVTAMTDLAQVLEDQGHWDDAIRLYEEAVRIVPTAAYAHFCLGLAQWQKGRDGEALAAFEAAVAADPEYVDARNNLGQALEKVGRVDEAEAQYRLALRHQPEAAEVHNNLGLVEQKRGNKDEARAAFETAIRCKPGLLAPRQNLAELLVREGEIGLAIAAYRDAIRLEPTRAEFHATLASLLINFGLQTEAEPALREAIRLDPEHGSALANLGKLLQVDHRYEEAQVLFRRAIGFAVTHPQGAAQAEAWLTETEQLMDREQQLRARVQRHIEDGTAPEEPDQRVTLARAALQCGHAAVAVEWFGSALEEAPGLADAVGPGHRRLAIRAAVMAAAGSPEKREPEVERQRMVWRNRALRWLEAETTLIAALRTAEKIDNRGLRRALSQLAHAPELASVREATAITLLPDEERAAWAKAWAQIDALLGEHASASR